MDSPCLRYWLNRPSWKEKLVFSPDFFKCIHCSGCTDKVQMIEQNLLTHNLLVWTGAQNDCCHLQNSQEIIQCRPKNDRGILFQCVICEVIDAYMTHMTILMGKQKNQGCRRKWWQVQVTSDKQTHLYMQESLNNRMPAVFFKRWKLSAFIIWDMFACYFCFHILEAINGYRLL